MADPLEPASPAEPGGPGASPEVPPPAPAARDDTAATPKNVSWPRLSRPDDAMDRPPGAAGRSATGKRFPLSTLVLAQVCGFGLLAGGYFLGQAWSPAPQPSAAAASDSTRGPSKTERTSSERALEAATRGLRAERRRDFRGARAIYDDMLKRQSPLRGAEYRLALLALHEGDLLQTDSHLNRSLASGDDVADCCLLRASLAGMKSNYADASTQLAAAARAQPFNARFFFCWGESLRREGKLTDAVERLTQTLDRPDHAVARELYDFKLRLAKVEAGGDEVFDSALADHLARSEVGGDWWLLSAAQAIGRRNFVAAAEALGKAKDTLPPATYATYVQDFLFQTQSAHTELRAYLVASPASANQGDDGPIQDPAVWTAAEADPGVWPPFPTAN